ncbi:LD-carboxypeptidase [Burkholderiaceae bacterium UC74_6]
MPSLPSPIHLPPLREGATLGLIAPAGPPRPERVEQVPALLQRMGFKAKIFPGVFSGLSAPSSFDFLAADDATRLADLHAALADPEVDAIYALRGGYGCARLTPDINLELLRRSGKPLIGYSDITTLHSLADFLGLPSWHAPMPASDLLAPGGERDLAPVAQALHRGTRSGDVIATPAFEAHALNRGVMARGRLVGGNLSVYVTLLGTPWQPKLDGAVLFLEDVGEAPYRVDRMLAHLRAAGVLDAVSGFVLGGFTDEEFPESVLAHHLHATGKPVLAGWPSGHCSPNVALPLGVEVVMDVAARTLTIA